MASNSIEFSINIGGTAYQGIAKISEAKDERHIPFSMTLISDYVETLEFV